MDSTIDISIRRKSFKLPQKLSFIPSHHTRSNSMKNINIPKKNELSSKLSFNLNINTQAKLFHLDQYLPKTNKPSSICLKKTSKKKPKKIIIAAQKKISQKAYQEVSSVLQKKSKIEYDNSLVTEGNLDETYMLKEQIILLRKECKKLEEIVRKYEKRYKSLKIKSLELENNKKQLENRLNEALKEIKDIKSFSIIEEENKERALVPYDFENNFFLNKQHLKITITLPEKYFFNITKHFISNFQVSIQGNQTTQEFIQEVENLIGLNESKINKYTEYYKKLIQNLKKPSINKEIQCLEYESMNNALVNSTEKLDALHKNKLPRRKKPVLRRRKSATIIVGDK